MISSTVAVPFLILFPERSGSTFLVSLLKSHPEINCYGEIFPLEPQKDGQRGRSSKYKTQDDVYQKLSFVYNQAQVKASGFKFKYPSQFEHYPEVAEYLLTNKDTISIIFLRRKNFLKAAISKQNQVKVLAAKGVNNMQKDNFEQLEKLNLEIDKAIRYMRVRKANDEYYYQQISDFKKVYHFFYEELVESYEKTIKDILLFLDVDATKSLSSDFKKITKDSLEDCLENYDEVVTKLSGTEWSQYLFM